MNNRGTNGIVAVQRSAFWALEDHDDEQFKNSMLLEMQMNEDSNRILICVIAIIFVSIGVC